MIQESIRPLRIVPGVDAGKALYIGVSEWTADQLRAGAKLARELQIPFISNQPQYSLLWRVIEGQVIPASRELGMGQIVWSPIAQGVLSGKYRPNQPPPPGSRAADERGSMFIEKFLTPEVLTHVEALRPIAQDAGLTMAQLAVAWVLQNPGVSSAIMGASRPEQVRENVKAAGVVLSPELMRRIDTAVHPVVEKDPSRTFSPATRP